MRTTANHVIERYRQNAIYQFESATCGLHSGFCPQCGARSLLLSRQSPHVLKCTRVELCGYQEKTYQ